MLKRARFLGFWAVSSLLIFGGSAPARAQTPLFTATGDIHFEFFGYSISAAGDVDADGVPDFAVGSDTHTSGSNGRVWIYSGATHEVLHTIVATTAKFEKVSLAPAGDFDLDGHDDVLLGVPLGNAGQGVARIVSGLDASVVHTFSGAALGDGFGETVGNAGDVNGDGRQDLIVSAPYRDVLGVENVGATVVYSGADGTPLLTFVGDTHTGHFGSSVDGIGDVDGDGHDDVAIGERTAGATGPGRLHVFSGFDGSLIRVHAATTNFHPGLNVAGLGDVNGDGVPDYAVGSPYSAIPPQNVVGRVRVFSGLDGSLLRELTGQAEGDLFGWAIDAAGDVDGDAVPDLLVGVKVTPLKGHGRAEIYSGADWSLLQTFSDGVPMDEFGRSVAAVGDTNGDGVTDVLIGYLPITPSFGRPGGVRLYSGVDNAPWTTYCDSLPNSKSSGALMSYLGSPSVSEDDVDLMVNLAVPGMACLFIYGPAQQQIPFGNGNLCVASGGVGIFRLQPFILASSGAGITSLDFSQPPVGGGPGMITPGSTWNFQAWFRDPFFPVGFNLSNGLSATFVP